MGNAQVPQGRLTPRHFRRWVVPALPFRNLNRPFGTYQLRASRPALKRRAIIVRPSGTADVRSWSQRLRCLGNEYENNVDDVFMNPRNIKRRAGVMKRN